MARLPDVSVEVVTPQDLSVAGLTDLQRGTTDLGIIMADVAYLAFAGLLDEASGPFDQLRGMALLNVTTFHFLVGANAHIDSIRQLKGRRVALGPVGSATALITEALLESYGLSVADVNGERLPYSEAVERLSRGTLDAAFMSQVLGSDSVRRATQAGARVLEIDGPQIELLRKRRPFLKRTLIPTGVYQGQGQPIHTLGVEFVMICRADLDEDIVYRILEAYFATPPGTTPRDDLESAPATPLPLHAGAARYYRQRELSR